MESRPKSKELFEELLNLMPGGVNSPARAFHGVGMPPLIAERAKGAELIDFDGYRFIDFNMAWGSLILGHVYPRVVEDAKNQLDKGSSFGLTTEIEYLFAKKLHELMPSIEKSRVVASGTEATMTAIRIARGFTNRPIIIKFNGHYHGHSDAFLVKAGSCVTEYCEGSSSKGVPSKAVEDSFSLPFNDSKAFAECMRLYGDKIAAVILEPVAGNMGVIPATEAFIKLIRHETQKAGALLIFDEVITGFRVAKGGATEHFGVKPDLTTLGKIVGGGFPIGVVGGRADVMDVLAPIGPVYQAGTLSGNPVALRGGLAALCEISKEGFYETLEKKMDFLFQAIEKRIEQLPIRVKRIGSMFSFFFGVEDIHCFEELSQCNREVFQKFYTHLFDKGIYLSPSPFEANFLSAAHSEQQLLYTQQTILEFIDSVADEMKTRSVKVQYDTSKL